MTLPFALRSRIRLRDEPSRSRALRLPPLALPIASYWAFMGVLTYGVASGALRPERLAQLRLLPAQSFTSSRLSLEPPAAPADVAEAPESPPQVAPTSSSAPAPSSPSPGPLAAVSPTNAGMEQPVQTGQEPPAPKAAVRPLAGFSLSTIQDEDGDRGSYAGASERDGEGDESTRSSRQERSREDDATPRVAARAHAPEEQPVAVVRAPSRNVPELPARDVTFPIASEFQPAARRAAVAMRASERRERALSLHRANPDDPYPGFRDDGAPAPERPEKPRETTRDLVEERLPAPPRPAPRSVASCEAAIAGANEEMDLTKSASGTPDVTRGAYAAVLERGSYLLPCGVPAGMGLDVCAAVRDGRAVGITVVTRPANAGVAACVRNAVAAIAFPKSPCLDVTRTRFDRAR